MQTTHTVNRSRTLRPQITLLLILGMILLPTRGSSEKPKHRRDLLIPKSHPGTEPRVNLNDGVMNTQGAKPPNHVASHNNSSNGEPTNSGLCVQKHSIEALVQIASHHSPVASPKGGVYFLSDLREVPQVFYLKTPKSWPEQISFFPDGVRAFKLSPDGEKLLLSTQVNGDEQYDIYLLQNNTLSPLLVDRTKRIESFAWDSTSTWFAFTSNARNKTDMDLYRFQIDTKEAKLLAELKGHHNVTDISPDGKSIALTHFVSVTDSDVLIWSETTKAITNLTPHTGQVYSESGYFTANSDGLYFLSDGETGISQLYFISLSKPDSRKLLTSGNFPIEEVAMDSQRTHLAYAKNQDGYSVLEGLEVDKAGQKRRLLSLPNLDRGILKGFSFTTAKGKSAFFYGLDSSLSPSRIMSWTAPKTTEWTDTPQKLLKPECFSRERLVHYPSFDGQSIPAFLYLPQDLPESTERRPIPFIVYLHGGPEAQFRPSFSKIFQYYLERGYGVFAPNVRGSLGYGRNYTLMDNYKKRMDSVKDALAGAKWLLSERYARSGELGVYGGSYGGFMVLAVIEEAPELFAAASESVGITNFVTFLENTKPYRRALREVEYGPLSDKDFLKSISPIHSIEKIKTPLYIFHGANDPRVPVSETEEIVKQLKKREIPVEVKIFPDEGHGNTKLRNILEQAKLMVYFFEKQFKKKEGAPIESMGAP